MSGEEKNKLDELFKSGLADGEPNFDYVEQDWKNMTQLMDAGAKRSGMVYWLPRLSGVAAALLLFLGWWFFKPNAVEPAQVAVVKHAAVQHSTDTSNQHQQIAAAQQPVSAETQPAGSSAPAHKVTAVHQIGVVVNRSGYARVKAPQTGNNNMPVQSTSPVPPVAGNSQQIAAASNDQPKSAPNTTTTIKSSDASQVNTATNSIAASTNPAVQTDVNAPASTSVTDNTQAAQPAVNSKGTKIKPAVSGAKGPQFALTILASPDINGAGSFQSAKIGTNIGLLFSVGVSKKLTISTGASYSKKPYLTNFDNYYTSYKFKINPTDVYADCRVLDIPINVDYKVAGQSRNSFSIGAGLSSYIMLREQYTYDYADPATAGPADYLVVNKNRHFLGVLNLNTTYEHAVNSRMSIAAQPYLKVPLTNIGYSQVRLQSAGIAVGVRWKLSH